MKQRELTQILFRISERQMRSVVAHADKERPLVHGAVLQELDGVVCVLDVWQRAAYHCLQVHWAHGIVIQLAVLARADLK